MFGWQLLSDICVGYILVTVLLYFYSPRMIFLPPKPASYQDNASITKIPLPTGQQLSAIHLKNPDAKYTLLYSHGNAEDLGYLSSLFQQYYDLGFSIIGYDYRGYGTSDGKSSEANSYEDIQAVYNYLTQSKSVLPENIILIGRSLGSGPSVDLAAKHKVGGMILESPLLTAALVLIPFKLFLVDRYNNKSKASKVNVPVLVIHGTQDEVIPVWHGEKLAKRFSGPTRLFKVEGAGHNNLITYLKENYWEAIQAFPERLNQSTPKSTMP